MRDLEVVYVGDLIARPRAPGYARFDVAHCGRLMSTHSRPGRKRIGNTGHRRRIWTSKKANWPRAYDFCMRKKRRNSSSVRTARGVMDGGVAALTGFCYQLLGSAAKLTSAGDEPVALLHLEQSGQDALLSIAAEKTLLQFKHSSIGLSLSPT